MEISPLPISIKQTKYERNGCCEQNEYILLTIFCLDSSFRQLLVSMALCSYENQRERSAVKTKREGLLCDFYYFPRRMKADKSGPPALVSIVVGPKAERRGREA